jgi:hypothetical protein
MLRRGGWFVAVATVLATCGGGGGGSAETASSAATSDSVATTVVASAEVTTTTLTESSTTSSRGAGQSEVAEASDAGDDDLLEAAIGFVAALDGLIEGTTYEHALLDDPEVFVATGMLLCERLSESADPADVLTEYIETLTQGSIDEADDDSLLFAGWILGAAVGNLCPEHIDRLEDSLGGIDE